MITPADVVVIASVTTVVTCLGGLLGWLLLRRRERRWSMHAALAVLVATPVLVMAVGMSVATVLMIVPGHTMSVMLAFTGVAALSAAVIGWLLAGRVHRLAEAHRRLAEAHDRELVTESARRELVTWMSHDLRAPLAAIRAMVEAMDDEVVTEELTVREYHRRIGLQVDRLSRMVTELFELTRITAGTLELRPEAVDVATWVGEVVGATESLAGSRGIQLSAAIDDHTEVRADHRHLVRALTNLVDNALRHTPSGGSVLIATVVREGDIIVSVQDECGGIAANDLPHVFDTGYRGEEARSPHDDSGTGLGLTIVRGLIEAHGGTLGAVNAGAGCRFDICLPLSRTERVSHHLREAAARL